MSGENKLRGSMGPLELITSSVVMQVMGKARRQDIYASCLTCIHFDQEKEVCNYQNCKLRPPATIIANGCDKYEDHDEIPF